MLLLENENFAVMNRLDMPSKEQGAAVETIVMPRRCGGSPYVALRAHLHPEDDHHRFVWAIVLGIV